MAAAGPVVFPNKATANFFALGMFGLSTFNLALIASSWTPNDATDEVFGDVTGELPTGGGYTAGGIALTSAVLSQTLGIVKFTSGPVVFTGSGGGFAACRHGVLFLNATLGGKVKPLVGRFLLDATPADIAATTAGNTISVTPNGLGWMGTM